MHLDLDNAPFHRAFDLIANTSESVFLTGRAGTGKTTFLKYLRENCSKQMVIVAPTGVAAINAGGVTINSFFQIKPGFHEPTAEPRYDFNQTKRKVLEECELLIIDEVSMVRSDLLEMVDKTCRVFGKKNISFGGKQVLFIGDPFQLPPIVDNAVKNVFFRFYQNPFFFGSSVFWNTKPIPIELKKIYRQSEQTFIELLNQVRTNNMTEVDLKLLNDKVANGDFDFVQERYLYLATHKDQVNAKNQRELDRLVGQKKLFKGILTGNFKEADFPTDLDLFLKDGAQVMFVKNDTGDNRRYYNGKIGVVQKSGNESIIVEFPNGETTTVERATWEKVRYEWDEINKKVVEKTDGTFIQFPLKLAWAITVHKSQGLSLERVFADVSEAWDSGQVYVALSRCTTFEGLKLASPISQGAIRVAPEVEEFYKWVTAETDAQEKPPVIELFVADTYELTERHPIRLAWDIVGAEKVVIVDIGEQPAKGSILVSIRKSTTYIITAYNRYGVHSSESISIKAIDVPPVIRYFTSDKAILNDEQPAHLQWEVEGAEEVYIQPSNMRQVPASGSFDGHHLQDTIYTLRAVSYFGAETIQQISIGVSKEPPVIHYFNSEREFTLADMGLSLSWDVEGAKQVMISPLWNTVQSFKGYRDVIIKEDTIFKLTATTLFGIVAEKEIKVRIIPVPLIECLLVPTLSIGTQLSVKIERPPLLHFTQPPGSPATPLVKLDTTQFVKPKINIPPRPSIWRIPEFSSAFEQLKSTISDFIKNKKS